MSTIIPFVPSNVITPSYPMTFDGSPYNVIVTWNVSAQRFYINIYDQLGNWIITTALVSTPPARAVDSIVYDPFLNQVDVQMVDPSLWPAPLSPEGLVTKPGTMVDYTLEGFTPNTYNGTFRCLTINPTQFSFPMLTDPGPVVIVGTVNRLIDMVATVFQVSTLAYRNGAFEVNP